MCVCVRACVHACVCVCARVCVLKVLDVMEVDCMCVCQKEEEKAGVI